MSRFDSGSSTLDETVDTLVGQFMDEFAVPGAALALVAPDRHPLVKGYGVRTLRATAAVDSNTQWAIASNSKAFLSACLALLVDEGRLGWDDPVVNYLPDFQLHDSAVTPMVTVADLLVHRSGLPLGAGDLMLVPRTDHSAADVLRGLRYFEPVAGFRTRYTYDNVLYVVAAMVLERVSGLSWDDFVAQRIFEPLEMKCAASNATLACAPNRASRHGRLGPPTRGIGELEIIHPEEPALLGPAGGIHLSAADMVSWLEVQLARGTTSAGRCLWTAARAEEMWQPLTITMSSPGPTTACPERPVLQGYALGWGVNDYRGTRMVTHGGAVAGQVSRTVLLPERGIGLFVCFNCEETQALSSLRYALIDAFLELPPFDWIAATRNMLEEVRGRVSVLVADGDFEAPAGVPTLPLDRYIGRYRDPWYGDLVVNINKGALYVDFLRTPLFKSALEPFGADCFRTRFPRGCEDAVLRFEVRDVAVAGITLEALSPLADFSFDFHHLAFVPVQGAH